MTDRPITFSAPMVLALLAGRKFETRRVVEAITGVQRLVCRSCCCSEREWKDGKHSPECAGTLEWTSASKVDQRAGDRLYVREAIERWLSGNNIGMAYVRYRADSFAVLHHWPSEWQRAFAPAMHMPRTVSRMTLPVTEVRIERLHDITEAGALNEGVCLRSEHATWKDWHVPGVEHPNKDFPYLSRATPREMYAALWDVIHGSGHWLSNPWVSVTKWHTVAHQNVDNIQS